LQWATAELANKQQLQRAARMLTDFAFRSRTTGRFRFFITSYYDIPEPKFQKIAHAFGNELPAKSPRITDD
jgi:hypothetical protein